MEIFLTGPLRPASGSLFGRDFLILRLLTGCNSSYLGVLVFCLISSPILYLIATALGGDAMPPSRFIGTDTIMNS
jgi:hypothetical protein